MIKIRSLRSSELKQVLSLLRQYTEHESEYAILEKMRQLFIPLQLLSQMLPIQFQFLPAIFVATAQKKVLGLIWLNKDGRSTTRWRIDQLILDPEASTYDIGTQLINYVINRYGAEGAQTFLAYVNHYYSTGLSLLKTCGFRQCNRIRYFTHQSPAKIKLDSARPKGVRESRAGDSRDLASLYNATLPPTAKTGMKKEPADFQCTFGHQLTSRMKGGFFKRWVIEDCQRNCVVGFGDLSSRNYQDFSIALFINPGWEDCFSDLLTFILQQVLLVTSSGHVHIECSDKATDAMTILKELGFTETSTIEILVKDYWIPVDTTRDRLQSPILLFSDGPNPAINLK